MSNISNIYSNVGATYDSTLTSKTKQTEKTDVTERTSKSRIPGKTIGNPKLSEEGQKYYEELRKKYHNMEFILVSEDQKESAKQKAASYAQKNKMVVLIDEDKIEKMATDSAYRKQYEGLIDKAANGFKELAASVASTGADVKGYGMQVNDDGSMSYFAVLKKQGEDQAKRIAKKKAEKQAEKKADAKKAAKEELKERADKASKKNKAEEATKENGSKKTDLSDDTVITANSIEELLQKLSDHAQMVKSDTVITESEKMLGQHVDFSA